MFGNLNDKRQRLYKEHFSSRFFFFISKILLKKNKLAQEHNIVR